MLLILLCEDKPIQLKEYCTIIQNHIMINEFNSKLQIATSNPIDIIDFLTREAIEIFDKNILVFIDIDLKKEITGLELGKWVRTSFPLAQIVFITTDIKYLLLAVEARISPLDYIIKNHSNYNIKSRIEEDLRYAYDYYLQCLNLKKELFKFKLGHEIKILPLNDILAIEASTSPHKVILSTLSEKIEFSSSIKDIHRQHIKLLKINRGILVNPENIIHFDVSKRLVTLTNSCRYEVSFRRIKDVKKAIKSP